MKIKLLLVLSLASYTFSYGQMAGYWYSKEFSKDIALFNSKIFLFNNVLGVSESAVKFEVTPLSAASSGELTTLIYKCEAKNKEGIILGFYGNYWNAQGVIYQGYSFKNLEKEKATDFLNKIKTEIDNNFKYLSAKDDNNNIFFSYDDMKVLVYASYQGYTIRLFWKEFDSTWEQTAFERSKKRFEKRIK